MKVIPQTGFTDGSFKLESPIFIFKDLRSMSIHQTKWFQCHCQSSDKKQLTHRQLSKAFVVQHMNTQAVNTKYMQCHIFSCVVIWQCRHLSVTYAKPTVTQQPTKLFLALGGFLLSCTATAQNVLLNSHLSLNILLYSKEVFFYCASCGARKGRCKYSVLFVHFLLHLQPQLLTCDSFQSDTLLKLCKKEQKY